MSGGQRIDWRAIPDRYRAWHEKPTWRKALWLVSRSVTMVVFYVLFAAAIFWYSEPDVVEGVRTGDESVWELFAVLGSNPELLVIFAIMVPAVAAAVLLPHRPDWR